MKSYSDIEQSKKLAEVLPLESADMYWDYDVQKHEYYPMVMDEQFDDFCIRAWSLAALLNILPCKIEDDKGHVAPLTIFKRADNHIRLYYCNVSYDYEDIIIDAHDNFVDACVDMIVKLHELNML